MQLSSLQPGPRFLGEVTPSEPWISIVQRHLEGRSEWTRLLFIQHIVPPRAALTARTPVREYSESEIRFNLLALVRSHLLVAEEHAARVFARLQHAYEALEAAGAVGDAAPPEAIAIGAGIDLQSLPQPVPGSNGGGSGDPASSATAADLLLQYEELQRTLAQAAAAIHRFVHPATCPLCPALTHCVPCGLFSTARLLSARSGVPRMLAVVTTLSRSSWRYDLQESVQAAGCSYILLVLLLLLIASRL